MSDQPDLKPCPFCGQKLVERGDYNDEGGWNWWQHDENSDCIAKDIRLAIDWNRPWQSNDEQAWNRRAEPAK